MSSPVSRLGWNIHVVISGRYQRDLQTLMHRLSVGLEVWMRSLLVDYLQQRVRNRFVSEGDDATGPWHPLSMVTEHFRTTQGYPPAHPINVRTGDLRNFLIFNRGFVLSLGGGYQLIYPDQSGSSLQTEKLKTAQRGKPHPNTPHRPVLALGIQDYNMIHQELAIFITRNLI